MTFRYIGSKARLISQIMQHIDRSSSGHFVDAFCGTGAVAEAASIKGWPVRLNDNLLSAVIVARARMVRTSDVRFGFLGGYSEAIMQLNRVEPRGGFFWRTYSPASQLSCGVERRYFTERNAAKIDAIRATISDWRKQNRISDIEENLLLADLISSANQVANIAGTFGCFLMKWTPQSQRQLKLRPRKLCDGNSDVEFSIGDVFDVSCSENDIVYLDPPYTKRQYAAYYHILETIAYGDEPTVEGVTGLRPWKALASDFSYKSKALSSITKLIDTLPARKIFLSYSSEGHVGMDELEAKIDQIGSYQIFEIGDVGRYRPNKVARDNNSTVTEFLIAIQKPSHNVAPICTKTEITVEVHL